MNKQMIDFHTHIFPDTLAEKAINNIAMTSGNMLVYSGGTKDCLIKSMNESNVEISVVLSIVTNERQMKKVNDFAISVNGHMGKIVSFGSVYPHSDSAISEIHSLKENGIKGVKLHPEYQDFYVDDDKYTAIYETLTSLNMITVFHAGMDNGFLNNERASAIRLKEVLKVLKSPAVFAHMGGYMEWLQAEKHLVGTEAYFDTSFCFSRIPLPIMNRMVKSHGCDKILFGSDTPWSTAQMERRLIDVLDICESDKENILHRNAKKLLEINI
jgi:predicted TIM-barrel fold metal-dependent hydrolase